MPDLYTPDPSLRDIFVRYSSVESTEERAAIIDQLREQAPEKLSEFVLLVSQPLPDQLLEPANVGIKLLDSVVQSGGDVTSPLDLAPPWQIQQPSVDDIHPGKRIGPYKLLEQIGEGGFGVVYMAKQTEPVRRKVALKIIKPGMDSKEVLARFESEKQSLALMDHPNIARVLDAGTTSTGRPYFAMELVHGTRITNFCDDNRLTTEQRLELFVDVCRAVQHAHMKGIIHRDLKPSNVLVTMSDGRPMVKVIDFGVSKALHQDLTEATMFTAYGQLIGTPMYMSPEQAQLSAHDIDVRSDVYSLGVILYELLTGQTPFDRDQLKGSGFDEMCRILREVDPPRPSDRLSTLRAEQVSTVCERRQLPQQQFSKSLAGELDWIVMKALSKERDRRFQSANDLAADIQRYLNDEAVEARPQSALYRLKKFAKRNKAMLATVSLVMLSLLIGIVATSWQATLAANARDDAVELGQELDSQLTATQVAREETRRQAAIANAVSRFLTDDLLGSASPENEPDRDVRVRTILDNAANSLREKFDDQPLVKAALHQTIGTTYLSLGELQPANDQLRQAIAIRLENLGPEHADTLGSQISLGWLLHEQDEVEEGVQFMEAVLKNAQQSLGRRHELTLDAMYALASLKLSQDEIDEARQGAIRVLELLADRDPLKSLDVKELLGETYDRQLDYPESLRLQSEIYEQRVALQGQSHVDTITSLTNLAILHTYLDRLDEAEEEARLASDLSRQVKGNDHPDNAISIDLLAAIYKKQGRLAESIKMSREALTIAEDSLRTDHQFVLIMKNSLGRRLIENGDYDEAIQVLSEALELAEDKLGPNHFNTILILASLAGAKDEDGELAESLSLFRQALSRLNSTGRGTEIFAVRMRVAIVGILFEQNAYEEAIGEAEQVVSIRNRINSTNPEFNEMLAMAQEYIASSKLSTDDFRGAKTHYELALQLLTEVMPDSWRRYRAELRLGRNLLELDDEASAEQLLKDGYEGLLLHKDDISALGLGTVQKTLQAIAEAYESNGDSEKAAIWKERLGTFMSVAGPESDKDD